MTDFYDATTERDYYYALQRRINNGSIWKLEGSAGRAAMHAIEEGFCLLGKSPCRDYWGNIVPSRYAVKKGTKGSAAYVREQMGRRWAHGIVRVQS